MRLPRAHRSREPGQGLGGTGAGPLGGGSAEELLHGLTTHTPVGVFVSDAAGACRFVNARWCELAGLTAAEALGDGWVRALHPDDRDRVAAEWAAAAAAGRDSVIAYRFLRPDGEASWIEGYATTFRDADGRLLGWVGSCLDVTAHRLSEQALQRERNLFSVAFDGAPIGMALVDLDGRMLRVNEALCHSLGHPAEELVGLGFAAITHPEDLEADVARVRELVAGEIGSYRLDKRYVRKDGSTFWATLSVSLIRDEQGAPLHFVAHVQDIHEQKLAEEELRAEAAQDALTGLPNRRRFEQELERWLRQLARDGVPAVLILVDVDRFKRINDSLGHQGGDDALVHVARVLRSRLREADVVARLGGDEFAVLARTGAGERLANDLLASVRGTRFLAAGADRNLTASAGIARLALGVDPAELVARADRALYAAKSAGRDRASPAVDA